MRSADAPRGPSTDADVDGRPAQGGLEFSKYLQRHASDLAGKVLAIEPADHPSDGELLKLARRYFVAADRMRVQPGTRPS